MASLPPDGEYLIQQIGDTVILFQRHTDEELARWDVRDADATAKAQQVIHDLPELSDEAKCFAHFWSGYFHGCLIRGA